MEMAMVASFSEVLASLPVDLVEGLSKAHFLDHGELCALADLAMEEFVQWARELVSKSSHTHAPGLGALGIKLRCLVDLSFPLSPLVSVHRTRAMPLQDPFCLSIVRAPKCSWQKHVSFSVLGVQGSWDSTLVRPTKEVDLRVLHLVEIVAFVSSRSSALMCLVFWCVESAVQIWCSSQSVL